MQTETTTGFEYLNEQIQKIGIQEPCFLLRAQDASASIVVKFWVNLQERLRNKIFNGMTLDEAVKEMERYYFLDNLEPLSPKQAEALRIAEGMASFSPRKIAD